MVCLPVPVTGAPTFNKRSRDLALTAEMRYLVTGRGMLTCSAS